MNDDQIKDYIHKSMNSYTQSNDTLLRGLQTQLKEHNDNIPLLVKTAVKEEINGKLDSINRKLEPMFIFFEDFTTTKKAYMRMVWAVVKLSGVVSALGVAYITVTQIFNKN